MPLYTYSCAACGFRTPAFRKIAERADAPKCGRCYGQTALCITATMVSVFQPYQTAAYDKEEGERLYIKNRAEHEAFLRRNEFEEVGNDSSMAPPCEEEIRHLETQNIEYNYDPDTQEASL